MEQPAPSAPPASIEEARPDFFVDSSDKLTFLERWNIKFNRGSITWDPINRFIALLQRNIGAAWVHFGSRHLRKVKGLDRLPELNELDSFIIVANHRSYFDLFVISMLLFRHGLKRRMLFGVRSSFFYDHPLGFFVNGAMSFWSMYPPFFRDKKRSSLNRTALTELSWTLGHTSTAVGLHPEGRRNQGDDPYTLLPAKPGVGQLVLETGVTVLPVFINGLSNSFMGQLRRNFTRSDDHMIVVFGEPVDFGDMLEAENTAKNQRLVSQHALDAVAALGPEERELRAALDRGERPEGIRAG